MSRSGRHISHIYNPGSMFQAATVWASQGEWGPTTADEHRQVLELWARKAYHYIAGYQFMHGSEIHVSDNIMKARKGFVLSRWQKAVEERQEGAREVPTYVCDQVHGKGWIPRIVVALDWQALQGSCPGTTQGCHR